LNNWRQVQAEARSQEETMRRIVLRLFQSPIPELETAIATGQLSQVVQVAAAAWAAPGARAVSQGTSCLETCAEGAAKVTASGFSSIRTARVRPRRLVLDEFSPVVLQYARRAASNLVVQLTADQQFAVRQIVVIGLARRYTPSTIARQVHEVAGLTKYQLGKYITTLTQQGSRAATRYAKAARDYRARVIAQTTTHRAAQEGQRQAWLEARKQGLLHENATRQWHTIQDERTCPTCSALDGQITTLAGIFILPNGSTVSSPPAHPLCRCGMTLTKMAVTPAPAELLEA